MLHPFATPPFNLYPQKKSRPFLKNIRPFFNEPSRNFHEALTFFFWERSGGGRGLYGAKKI